MSNAIKSEKSAAANLIDVTNNPRATMDEVAAAIAHADAKGSKGKKGNPVPTSLSADAWAHLSSTGVFALGTQKPGHVQFFKGVLPRLSTDEARMVRAALSKYGFKF